MKMNVYIVNFRYDLIILGSLPLNIVQEIFIWDDEMDCLKIDHSNRGIYVSCGIGSLCKMFILIVLLDMR